MTSRFDPALLPEAPDLSLEQGLWDQSIVRVCGIDEAGRGALAGPVAAAAVILPLDPDIRLELDGLHDSKALSPHEREAWVQKIGAHTIDQAVGFAGPGEIDALGIVPATRLAAQRALDQLPAPPDHLVLDYLFLPENPLPQTSLIKGDERSLSIAAASILAKVARDHVMMELSKEFKLYGFEAHKGYGTQMHRSAIEKYGPCPAHRLSFAPFSPNDE